MSSNGGDESVNGHRVSAVGTRLTKACVGCRKQKMKCEPERDGPCKRCRNNQTECIFKPRANARQPDPMTSPQRLSITQGVSAEVKARLDVIESILGIRPGGPLSPAHSSFTSSTPYMVPTQEEDPGDPSLSGLWQAADSLKKLMGSSHGKVWSRTVISQLWSSFYENMEGLHFQSESEASKNPTPLLLAAILYVSALHHTSEELAAYAPDYFKATCSAIAELSVPETLRRSTISTLDDMLTAPTVEQNAYQNVLGLILAGLISEAFIDVTGIWISIGYRLILDHCPVYVDQTVSKWRQLFSGLQIIDVEHASLHLSCTVIPNKAPLPSLRQVQNFTEDPFSALTIMMHTGLGHFTGRGLPTIWSFIASNQADSPASTVFPFTDRDTQVIKEWAKSLDDWLVSSNRPTNTNYDSIQIRRQYILHRLFVLSIYHPARGFNLFDNSVAAAECHELLLSARATLRLQKDDKGIWANWDLVMITWAAMLVLQGAEGGFGEHGDLLLVQHHLDKLKKTKRPAPSLHHTLASRLETWLQRMNIPPTATLTQPEFDPTWSLFDQNSIRIASETFYQPDNLNGMQNLDHHSGSPQDRNSSLGPEQPQSYEPSPDFWSAYGTPMGSWPLGFTRLFGNAGFQEPNMADRDVQ